MQDNVANQLIDQLRKLTISETPTVKDREYFKVFTEKYEKNITFANIVSNYINPFFIEKSQGHNFNEIVENILKTLQAEAETRFQALSAEAQSKTTSKKIFHQSLTAGIFSWTHLFIFHGDAKTVELLKNYQIPFDDRDKTFHCTPLEFLAYRVLNQPKFDEILTSMFRKMKEANENNEDFYKDIYGVSDLLQQAKNELTPSIQSFLEMIETFKQMGMFAEEASKKQFVSDLFKLTTAHDRLYVTTIIPIEGGNIDELEVYFREYTNHFILKEILANLIVSEFITVADLENMHNDLPDQYRFKKEGNSSEFDDLMEAIENRADDLAKLNSAKLAEETKEMDKIFSQVSQDKIAEKLAADKIGEHDEIKFEKTSSVTNAVDNFGLIAADRAKKRAAQIAKHLLTPAPISDEVPPELKETYEESFKNQSTNLDKSKFFNQEESVIENRNETSTLKTRFGGSDCS